jgi:hypothetical protein
MGLRQTISKWIADVKDELDFGTYFPTSAAEYRATFTDELRRLQGLLKEARKAAQEKDSRIAELQARGTSRADLVIDDRTYYLRSGNTLDGPFCPACFEQKHEMVRIVPAAKPSGADGGPAEWVQCSKCQTPFRSERIGRYVNPPQAAPTSAAISAQTPAAARPARAPRKRHPPARPSQEQPPAPARPAPRRRTPRRPLQAPPQPPTEAGDAPAHRDSGQP